MKPSELKKLLERFAYSDLSEDIEALLPLLLQLWEAAEALSVWPDDEVERDGLMRALAALDQYGEGEK